MKKYTPNIAILSIAIITSIIIGLFFTSKKNSQEHISDWLSNSPNFNFYDFTIINNEIEEILENNHLD